MSDEIEAVVEEVKGSFDLGGFLKGAKTRFKTVRVYTDSEAGAELGGTRIDTQYGFITGSSRVGLIGETLDLSDRLKALSELEEATEATLEEVQEIAAQIDANKVRIDELHKQLDESALDFEIQSLPPVIQKDAGRRAKNALGIKGKVPEARQEEYDERRNAEILSLATMRITKVATGERNPGITPEDAQDILDYLPDSEQRRLAAVLEEVALRSGIADKLASSSDFSQGI